MAFLPLSFTQANTSYSFRKSLVYYYVYCM